MIADMMVILPQNVAGGSFLFVPLSYATDGPIVYGQNIIITALIALCILFLAVKAAFDYFSQKKQQNLKFVFDILFDHHLQYKFPGQTKETLSCLKNGVRAMLAPQVRRPAVLLLLAADDSRSSAMDLALRLLQVTAAAIGQHKTEDFITEHLFVDGNYFSTVSDFWEFYNVIRNKIKQHKMILIYNFQAVHPHAVTVLPSLTHEVFCPQSQALIVLLLSLNCYRCPNKSDFSSTRLAVSSVEQTFGPALDSGQLDDLLRTVTARAALILPEKNRLAS